MYSIDLIKEFPLLTPKNDFDQDCFKVYDKMITRLEEVRSKGGVAGKVSDFVLSFIKIYIHICCITGTVGHTAGRIIAEALLEILLLMLYNINDEKDKLIYEEIKALTNQSFNESHTNSTSSSQAP